MPRSFKFNYIEPCGGVGGWTSILSLWYSLSHDMTAVCYTWVITLAMIKPRRMREGYGSVKCQFSPACAIAQEHRLNLELGPEGRASTGLQVTLVPWGCLKECACMAI